MRKNSNNRMNEVLKLENQLCFPVYAASRLIVQAYGPHLKKIGITYPQYIVLLVLWEEDGQTLKEIGSRLLLDSGTLTPVLKKLEQEGFILRRRSKNDERVVHSLLTDRGRRLKADAFEMAQNVFCESGLSNQDVTFFKAAVDRLLNLLVKSGLKKLDA